MGEVVKLRKISTRYQALQWGGEWEARCQHLEANAGILELIIVSYKLQLKVAEKEIERLRALI